MKILVRALFFLSLNVCNLKAEMSVADYRKNVASGELSLTKVYVLGLGEGIRMTNVVMQLNGKGLFCAPKNLALGVENFVDILDRSIKDASVHIGKAELDEKDISVLLLRGIIDTFPCASDKR